MLRGKLLEFYDGEIPFVWRSTRASCFMFFNVHGCEIQGRLRLWVFAERFTFGRVIVFPYIRQNHEFLLHSAFLRVWNNRGIIRFTSYDKCTIIAIHNIDFTYNRALDRKKYSWTNLNILHNVYVLNRCLDFNL